MSTSRVFCVVGVGLVLATAPGLSQPSTPHSRRGWSVSTRARFGYAPRGSSHVRHAKPIVVFESGGSAPLETWDSILPAVRRSHRSLHTIAREPASRRGTRYRRRRTVSSRVCDGCSRRLARRRRIYSSVIRGVGL
jgi:hypothetical protein